MFWLNDLRTPTRDILWTFHIGCNQNVFIYCFVHICFIESFHQNMCSMLSSLSTWWLVFHIVWSVIDKTPDCVECMVEYLMLDFKQVMLGYRCVDDWLRRWHRLCKKMYSWPNGGSVLLVFLKQFRIIIAFHEH